MGPLRNQRRRHLGGCRRAGCDGQATPVELTEPEQPKDNPEVTETPEATGVTVSGDGVADGALSLKKGTTAQLTAKVAPDDADQAVTWAPAMTRS